MAKLSTKELDEQVRRMALLDQLPLWSTEQFCEYYGVALPWLHGRTGPKSKLKPFIPTLKTIGHIRIDRKIAQAIMSQYQQADHRSVKTEKTGKSTAKQPKREFVQLW